MKFTGERFVPSEQGKIRLEHYHRYAIALDIVVDKDVLDLACGEGYGSSKMAEVARSVVGVDISEESVIHADKTYKRKNLSFRQGSATAVNFPDASFDIVVSFETVEHLADQEEMIAEIRRVLRPNGILVISSPNRPVYSEESGEKNEFHVKELDFNEFNELLKTQFPAVNYYGQRMLMGSVIQSFEGGDDAYRAWHDDGVNLLPQSGNLQDPVYFVALAASKKNLLPKIESSIIYPDDLDLVKHYVGFAKWAQTLDVMVHEKDEHIISLNQEIHIRDQQIGSLNETVTERDKQMAKRDEQVSFLTQSLIDRDNKIVVLDQNITLLNQSIIERDTQNLNLTQEITNRDAKILELTQAVDSRDIEIINLDQETVRRGEWALGIQAELDKEREKLRDAYEKLDAAMKSNSWRLTHPLRESKRWASEPKTQARRYIKKSLNLAKRFYQSLPLEIQTIENHRNIFVKHVPKLLAVTDTRFDGNERRPISIEDLEAINIPDIPQEYGFFEGSDNVENAKTIEINSSENPLVTVIIPIYGKIGYTLNCLASIAANPPQVPFEIIVVDDCSPDDSFDVLTYVRGINLVKSDKNQGFIGSCNSGADIAKGEYLYFLNNDTQVTPRWMDELVRTFREFPGTGLAGSKLIYPDGTLQEAGGIIWQDGSAWNFGRLQNSQLPVFNYAREVDYCSGASIMVPKDLFNELGGFDEYYSPAYCEDSDLALKIRNQGYRVIYQPLSTIIHYEGITSGTDTNEGPKSYQIENTKKLYSRWKDRLSTHQIAGNDIDKAKDRRADKRVLVLEHCTPTPNQDAGSVTVFNLLLLLREMDFQVTFIPEDNFLYMPEYTTALQRIGVEVLYAPYVISIEQHLKEYGTRYDLAFLFRPGLVERNIKKIREYCPQAKVLYYTHDLHFLRMEREAALLNDKEKAKEAEEMKLRELSVINDTDASILVSQPELEIVKNEISEDKLYVLPLILNTPGTDKKFAERQDIIFVGGFQHTPNIDAVNYFVTEIMPLLRRDLLGVKFYAVGSKVPDEIKELASDDVIITGFVEDLIPMLNKMRISVAPLRYGAGVKGKIGTAMSVGLPVVATSLAAEGMSLSDGDNVLIGDSPEDFTKAVVKLYNNEDLWNKISRKSLEFADKTWGAEAAWNALFNIITEMNINVIRNNYSLSLYTEFDRSSFVVENQSVTLSPIVSVRNRKEFELGLKTEEFSSIRKFEEKLLKSNNTESFNLKGFCIPCNKKVSFLVDMKWGGQKQGNAWLPNWRERLECPSCNMNNRQRLMATLIKQTLENSHNKQVYFMEQITPIYKWVTESFKEYNIIGSEYLGFEYKSGTVINGIRHEDVENLSFLDEELDLIVSNDVFEHVPNPIKAFAECARVLKHGGTMLLTMPFFTDKDESVCRATVLQNTLHHRLEPIYHGNPVSDEGSLVFTDFGWDILDEIKAAKFKDVYLEIYNSSKAGHLGNGQIVFRLVK